MSNLTTIIQAGLNNPDCAFYTGAFVGQIIAIRYILFLIVIYFIFKVLDKLIVTPFLDYIKNLIFKKRDKKNANIK